MIDHIEEHRIPFGVEDRSLDGGSIKTLKLKRDQITKLTLLNHLNTVKIVNINITCERFSGKK